MIRVKVKGQHFASWAVQSLHHLGYDPDDKDFHDMRLLADRFGIDLPAPYRGDRDTGDSA